MIVKTKSGNGHGEHIRAIEADEARYKSKEIQCRICENKETVQKHSYCCTSRLCVDCANREFSAWMKERD